MNRRTQEINSAIAKLKQHHKNCILGGRSPVEGAHLIPRNNPAKNNDPTKIGNIVPLCRRCHISEELEKDK